MFYDNFVQLCERKGVKPSRAAIESGVAKSAVSNWKANWEQGIEVFPSNLNAKALSNYFDVTVDVLLNENKNKHGELLNDIFLDDEFVAFYGDTKEDLTQADMDDIKALMRLRAELNRGRG